MSSDSEKTLRFRMNTPPSGVVGGHTPNAYVDGYDASESQGFLAKFINSDPNRFGKGRYGKRRSWIRALTRPGSDPIVNIGYLKGINCRIGGAQVVRDVLFALLSPVSVAANHYFDACLRTYTGSNRYTAANWSAAWSDIFSRVATGTGAVVYEFWRNGASRDLWAGIGTWVSSALGKLRMALGPYLDGPIAELEFIDRKTGAMPFDGFFANPSVGADADGREEYSDWCVHAAKPWTPVDATYGVLTITPCSPRSPNHEGTNIAWRSGECFEGWYDFALCPMNALLEPGPPIMKKRYFLQDDPVYVGVSYRWRGRTLRIIIDGIKKISAGMRPDIRLFGLYGKYTNTNPNNSGSIWTNPYSSGGYNLPTIPENTEYRLIAFIDTNGRQYDIPATGSYSDAPTAAGTGFVHSDKFNYFNDLSSIDGFIDVTAVVNGTNIDIKIPSNSMYNRQYYPIDPESGSAAAGAIYVEIDGYQGVYSVLASSSNGWTLPDANDPYQVIKISSTNAPSAANITRIRFCYPWNTGSGSNNQLIYVYTSGPKFWSREHTYPFTDDADVNFEGFYPHPQLLAESPSGAKVICARVKDINSNEKINNRIYATNGIFQTMFTLGLDVEGEVTGIAFLDENKFIATTNERSYIGEYFELTAGQLAVQWIKLETPYGHTGWSLHRDGEGNVYGLDSRFGLWVVGPAGSAIRQDLPPVGPQMLVWNKSQREYFFKTFADMSVSTNANRLSYASILRLGEKTKVALPKFTT